MRTKLTAIILLGTLIMPPTLQCGSFDYSVSVGVGEEYNDNVNERPDAKADWVSKATVNGKINYVGPRVEGNASVDGSYNLYALGNRTNEFKGGAQAKLKVEAVKDLIYIEGEDKLSQVYSSITRGETNETDSNRQQVFQNESKALVYITPHITERLALKAGYEFRAWTYLNNQPETTNGFGRNKWNHRLFAGATYDLTPTIALTMDADASRQEPQESGFTRTMINAGFKWQYSENGIFTAKAGPRFTHYDNGTTSARPYWEGRLTHTFGRIAVSAETSSLYEQNPSADYDALRNSVGGSVGYRFDRGSLEARARYSFVTGEDTQNSNQLSLSIVGTYELTPSLAAKVSGTREFSLTSSRSLTRWYVNGSLQYELGRGFSVEGYYRWKLSEASQGVNDNYFVNIVGLQFRKTF